MKRSGFKPEPANVGYYRKSYGRCWCSTFSQRFPVMSKVCRLWSEPRAFITLLISDLSLQSKKKILKTSLKVFLSFKREPSFLLLSVFFSLWPTHSLSMISANTQKVLTTDSSVQILLSVLITYSTYSVHKGTNIDLLDRLSLVTDDSSDVISPTMLNQYTQLKFYTQF